MFGFVPFILILLAFVAVTLINTIWAITNLIKRKKISKIVDVNNYKNEIVYICKKYNETFKVELKRDLLPDLIKSFEANEGYVYTKILYDNIFKVDPEFSKLTSEEIELIKQFKN